VHRSKFGEGKQYKGTRFDIRSLDPSLLISFSSLPLFLSGDDGRVRERRTSREIGKANDALIAIEDDVEALHKNIAEDDRERVVHGLNTKAIVA